MKNLLKLIGVITLAMVIAFSMTACEDPVVPEEVGKLTITGFEFDVNGYFVMADTFDTDTDGEAFSLFAAKRYSTGSQQMEFGQIINRRVSLNVWEGKGGTPVLYEGDEAVTFKVYVFEKIDDEEPEFEGTVDVTFIKGLGVGEVSSLTGWTP
ncbi:MAG: hypothetical protein FWD13_10125 [Treponema sp.]|nr:hypothetical protein [Treponema sp.]